MTIYQITEDKLEKVAPTTFAAEGIRERADLQRLLREQIEVISPNTLVVATITLGDTVLEGLPKGRAIFGMVKYLCDAGVDPEEIHAVITWKKNSASNVTATPRSTCEFLVIL